MVRIEVDIALQYEVGQAGADFIFNIQPSNFGHQSVISEALYINQNLNVMKNADPQTGNRTLRLHANPGQLSIRAHSLVEINHLLIEGNSIAETPVNHLPQAVLKYLMPSRYCQSDRFYDIATQEFGSLQPGYSRVQAICQWAQNHLTFTSGASDNSTSAVDVLLTRKGVCRDYAHLMISLCRALNIPARFATGTDYGADPSLGPPDFHAYVEAFVGNRWYIFDPSGTSIPMGVIRLGSGKDAAEVPFANIFGPVRSMQPVISAVSILSADIGCYPPYRTALALSSDPFDNSTIHSGNAPTNSASIASTPSITNQWSQ